MIVNQVIIYFDFLCVHFLSFGLLFLFTILLVSKFVQLCGEKLQFVKMDSKTCKLNNLFKINS